MSDYQQWQAYLQREEPRLNKIAKELMVRRLRDRITYQWRLHGYSEKSWQRALVRRRLDELSRQLQLWDGG